jgi:hypothetical protein
MTPDELQAELAQPSPCDGCAFVEQCRRDDLACAAFASYAAGARQVRWQQLQRVPTKAHFAALFG